MSKHSKIFNKNLLIDLYNKHKLTACQIAINYKVHKSIIYYWLRQHNIKRRSNSEVHQGLQVGDKNPNWHGGKPKCKDCKKQLPFWGRVRCTICSKIGELNSNWQEGISKLPYPFEFNNNLKEQIRKRDHYTCQLCNKEGIIVHHIDYNKFNCKKKNLITTCKSCNSKVNFNRDYWYAYFRYIMENR